VIDRHGKRVYVGWAEHEVLWLEAALTLPRDQQYAAFHDIAEMRGSTFATVARQAGHIAGVAHAKARALRLAEERARPVPPPLNVTVAKYRRHEGARA
jgi:hypothetical protein